MNPVSDRPEPLAWTRRDSLLLLLLAALVALFFWRILTPNPADRAQFPPGDFTDQFYAFRLYEARSLSAGRLPLWSENFNSGHPFLADVQAAVYYPIGFANTLLNVALSGPNFSLFALELEALLHFFLAGAFTYLFARQVIGGRPGAFAAAIVFTFGGYLTSYPSLQLAILETATWLPLALYFLHRATAFDPPHPFPLSPLGRGEVEVLVPTGWHRESSLPLPASGGEGAGGGGQGVQADSPLSRWNGRISDSILAGLVLGVAALAGHPQTFLFVIATSAAYFIFRVWTNRKFSANANRRLVLLSAATLSIALGISAAQWVPSVEYQQLSTREALSFREAASGFPTLDLLQLIFPGFTSAFASPLYVGVLPLWLVCLALVRKGRERTFWALIALAALVLSFGFYVFGYALVYLLPGGGLFRQQERLAFVVSFALALLSGFGLNDLATWAPNALKWSRKLFLLLPAGMATAFALLVTFFAAGALASSGRLAFLGDRAGLMLVSFALASGVVALYLRAWISPRVFLPLALALILLDLFSVNEPANKGSSVDPFPPNPLIETVRQDSSVFRVSDEQQLPGHFGIAYQLEEIGGISPLRLAGYENLLSLPRDKLFALLGVKYVFRANPGAAGSDSTGQDGQTHLLKLDNSLPRAWLVGSSETIADDSIALERMSSPDFDPRKDAILASPSPFEDDPRAQAGSVTIQARDAESLALAVNSLADGLLVVSENYYPGWVARVDGVPVNILRADISLRALPLRAGTHQVEFTFEPFSVKLGLAISVLTFLSSLVTLLLLRFEKLGL